MLTNFSNCKAKYVEKAWNDQEMVLFHHNNVMAKIHQLQFVPMHQALYLPNLAQSDSYCSQS